MGALHTSEANERAPSHPYTNMNSGVLSRTIQSTCYLQLRTRLDFSTDWLRRSLRRALRRSRKFVRLC